MGHIIYNPGSFNPVTTRLRLWPQALLYVCFDFFFFKLGGLIMGDQSAEAFWLMTYHLCAVGQFICDIMYICARHSDYLIGR